MAASPAVEFEQYGGWQRGANNNNAEFRGSCCNVRLNKTPNLEQLARTEIKSEMHFDKKFKDNLPKEGEQSFEDKNAGLKRDLHKSLAFVS